MADKVYHTRDFDELLQRTKINIDKCGLQVISINGSEYLPPFSYSVGVWQSYSHPEIICFGLKIDLMHAILNDVAGIIKRDGRLNVSVNYTNIFKDSDAQFLPVDPRNVGDYFGIALKYYKCDQIPAMQLVWTDQNNRFPWESDFQEGLLYKQPLLDRNAGFKFREAKNLGIFTTRQWLELDWPILRVVHDFDGDWRFLTGDQLPEDGRLVCLDEVVQKDATLNDVFNLEYGEVADRAHLRGKWTRRKFDK